MKKKTKNKTDPLRPFAILNTKVKHLHNKLDCGKQVTPLSWDLNQLFVPLYGGTIWAWNLMKKYVKFDSASEGYKPQ